MGVIRRDDAGLRMIQAALGNVRTDAELGEASAYRSPKVMQSERTYFVFSKGVEVTCDASGQQLGSVGPSPSSAGNTQGLRSAKRFRRLNCSNAGVYRSRVFWTRGCS